MMEINNVFKNEREIIRKAIASLPKDSCIENFDRYLDLSVEGEFERSYIKSLNDNLMKLANKILMNKYSKLSKEELLKVVIDSYIDAPYSCTSYIDNHEFYEFILDNTDSLDEAHMLIKDYMEKCYIELINEIDSSKKQNEINRYKNMIKEKENNIQRYEEDLRRYKEKLVQLGE